MGGGRDWVGRVEGVRVCERFFVGMCARMYMCLYLQVFLGFYI